MRIAMLRRYGGTFRGPVVKSSLPVTPGPATGSGGILAGAALGFAVANVPGALVGAFIAWKASASPSPASSAPSSTQVTPPIITPSPSPTPKQLIIGGDKWLTDKIRIALENRLAAAGYSQLSSVLTSSLSAAAEAAGVSTASVMLPAALVYFGPAFLASIMPGSWLTPADVMALNPANVSIMAAKAFVDSFAAVFADVSPWDRLTPAQQKQYTSAVSDLASGHMPDLEALAHTLGAMGTKTIGTGTNRRVIGGGHRLTSGGESDDSGSTAELNQLDYEHP